MNEKRLPLGLAPKLCLQIFSETSNISRSSDRKTETAFGIPYSYIYSCKNGYVRNVYVMYVHTFPQFLASQFSSYQPPHKHACVKKIRRIWWIRHDGSWNFQTRAAEVSSTAVRGGFDRFLMTPWNVGQNPSFYKKRARLVRVVN